MGTKLASVATGLKTAVCGEYERLLEKSHAALRTWTEERAAIYESGARGRDVDLELLRLQAGYAGAYARLQRHARECSRCRLVAWMAEGNETRAGAPAERAGVELHLL
jgi:hypothetical protein